ncbi:MAG TPA: hypothetical protein VHQ47_06040 [Phycisphaerae bacterium]|nr:hypothetical protein [Phycisphaerae bacterium]
MQADDPETVRKFREEQAQASAGKPPAGDAIFKSVTIDDKPFETALGSWKAKTRFIDRVCYGDLLLAADKGSDAEKLFKELFQLATTQDELTMATEGIAKSLRAEDGNVARANVWLTTLQQQGGSTLARRASAPPKSSNAAKPTTSGSKDADMP